MADGDHEQHATTILVRARTGGRPVRLCEPEVIPLAASNAPDQAVEMVGEQQVLAPPMIGPLALTAAKASGPVIYQAQFSVDGIRSTYVDDVMRAWDGDWPALHRLATLWFTPDALYDLELPDDYDLDAGWYHFAWPAILAAVHDPELRTTPTSAAYGFIRNRVRSLLREFVGTKYGRAEAAILLQHGDLDTFSRLLDTIRTWQPERQLNKGGRPRVAAEARMWVYEQYEIYGKTYEEIAPGWLKMRGMTEYDLADVIDSLRHVVSDERKRRTS